MVTNLSRESKAQKGDSTHFDLTMDGSSWFNGLQMSDSIPPATPRNLQQEFERKLQMQQEFGRNWDRDSFAGPDSHLGLKIVPNMPPPFSYSQKNFHIDDGNLYSIFSPFQARKSTSKPSFLRGRMMSDDSNLMLKNSVDIINSPLAAEGSRKSRLKLKFHQQDIPPQYRTETKDSSSTSFNARKFHSLHHESSSSFSQSLFSESREDSFFHSDRDFSSSSLFRKRDRKGMAPFEALDLSKQQDILNCDWERKSDSGHCLRRSPLRRSFFEDSDDDDDDDDEPLNLCIADQLKQKKFPDSLAGERIKKMQRNFFANRSPNTSIFRSPSIEFTHTVDESEKVQSHRQSFKVHEEEAMDLSYRTDEKLEKKMYKESTRNRTSEKTNKLRKVPYISEMLQNMTIWDEQSRSPNPADVPEANVTQSSHEKNSEQNVPISEAKSDVAVNVSMLGTMQPQKSKSDSMIKTSAQQQRQLLAAVPANYYVFVPSPFMQLAVEQRPAANIQSTQDLSEMKKDAVTIQVPSPKQSASVRPKVMRSKSGQLKQFGDVPQQSSLQSDNNVNICKFKLIKGVQPMLEEKKNFFVPLPQSVKRPLEGSEHNSPSKAAAGSKGNHFRTYKIHVGLQEEIGRKLAAGRKIRRRSRKALARDKLEATFREQGFLIKTQQVSSAEGSVYCKFRQLKKFTRYLFKSWRNYLPKDLEEIGNGQVLNANPNLTLSLPDIPGTYEQLYSVPTARSASATFGPGYYGLDEKSASDNATNKTGANSVLVVSDTSSMSDSFATNVSPSPSTSSLTPASSTSSVP